MKILGKCLIASGLVVFALLSSAHAGEYWLTPDTSYGADGMGSGTASSPWVRSTASSFDACLNGTGCVPATGIPNNSTIHLMAGTFLTVQGVTFKPGWKLLGAGMDVTIVKFDVLSADPNDGCVIGGTMVDNYWYYAKDNTAVSDLTVDVNMQAQPSTIPMAPGAVGLSGHNSRISRVKAINWATTKAAELFIISIGTHALNEIKRNCVIESCIIGAPAASPVEFQDGVSAINILGSPNTGGTPGAGWIEGGEIRNCFVKDIQVNFAAPGVGTPTYFHAFNATGVGMKVRNNIAINLGGPAGEDSTATYMECGSFVDYVIENNMFLDVTKGIYLNGWGAGCSGDTTLSRRHLYFRNNVITVKTGGAAIALGGYPGGIPGANKPLNVTIQNNTIHSASGAAGITGISVSDTDSVKIEDNIADANGGTGISIGGGVPSAWVNNNRKIDGTAATTTGSLSFTAEKYEVIFTPSAAGWYRLIRACNYHSGTFYISGTFDNRITDLEFTYDNPWTANLGNITLLRHMNYGGGNVSKIRISSDPWVDCKLVYVDIYIPAITTAGPLTVLWQPPKTAVGQQFTSVSYLGATPPTGWDYEYIMDVTRGFHTIAPIYVGSANTQLTDAMGKVLGAALSDDAVADTKLRNSAALSVIGRNVNLSGDPADIQATVDGQVLRLSGTTLGFGTIETAGLSDNAISNAKLRDSGPWSVIGRTGAVGIGDPADIVAGSNGDYLRVKADSLSFGPFTAADLPAHSHAAADIISGLIATARLAGSGTANSSTFLRGDQTWAEALQETTEASSTPVADDAQISGNNLRLFEFYTLPTSEKLYIITGIEWKNGTTVLGDSICGAVLVNANPPTQAAVPTIAFGQLTANSGPNSVQRVSRIVSQPIRGGTTIGLFVEANSSTHTYRIDNTSQPNVNTRKTVSFPSGGNVPNQDNTAWTSSATRAYVKVYYQGYK